jgi:hypothetical protein
MSVDVQELSSYLDSDVVVTSNWISSTFDLSNKEATSLLERYWNGYKDTVLAHFCITGMGSNGAFQVRIVPQNERSDRSGSLYSIQRKTSSSSIGGSGASNHLVTYTDMAIREKVSILATFLVAF